MKGRQKGTPAPNKGKSHRPPSTTISIRLPVSLLEEARAQAGVLDITWNRFAVEAITKAVRQCAAKDEFERLWCLPREVEEVNKG